MKFVLFLSGLMLFSCQKSVTTASSRSTSKTEAKTPEKVMPVFSINFSLVEESSFVSIKERAVSENKIIFVDMYADWCGPCKHMDANVFSQESIANEFNSRFINYKVDAEDFDGYNVAKKYAVRSYPTYLFLKPNGEVLYRLEGVYTEEGLLEEASFAESLFKKS